MSFDFVQQQEQLRERLRKCGETPARISSLHPDLKERWVAGFARKERPSALPHNLNALQCALDRLDEIRAFEKQLVVPVQSSSATA